MKIKTALYNTENLEYVLVTIPFPIPQDQLNGAIKIMEALDIGTPRMWDGMVEESEGEVPGLKCLEEHQVNMNELNHVKINCLNCTSSSKKIDTIDKVLNFCELF